MRSKACQFNRFSSVKTQSCYSYLILYLHGIPKAVESKHLEHSVCNVFNSIGFDIGEDRTEACHWLTIPDRTIIEYSLRKDC